MDKLMLLLSNLLAWYSASMREHTAATLAVTILVLAVALWVYGHPERRRI